MQHHHIADGKGMSGKICRVVYIELCKNIINAHALLQLPGINKLIILFRYRNPFHFKVVHCHIAKIPCFIRAFKLVDAEPVLSAI